MYTTICMRFGLVAGSAIGFFVGLLRGVSSATPQPTLLQLAADGVLVGLVALLIAAAYTCLVTGFPKWAVFALAVVIALVTGVLLGPVAYHITHPAAALIVCAYLGALLGWLICQIRCRTSVGNTTGSLR